MLWRCAVKVMPGILSQAHVPFLPVVAAFVKKIGVDEVVDRPCAMESDVRPGLAVSAMILDTLSGLSPLYRFERFFSELDTELLLGETMLRRNSATNPSAESCCVCAR